MLGFFKYGDFLLKNFTWIVAQLGITYQAPQLERADPAWARHLRGGVLHVGLLARDGFLHRPRLVQPMTGLLPGGDAILPTREILQVRLVTAGLLGAHWFLRNTTIEAVVARLPRPLLTGFGRSCAAVPEP